MAHSLILHIPHASTNIPFEDKNNFFLLHDEAITQELLAMTDWYTDELFDHAAGKAIVAPVSRLVCDMERFSHDEEEPMAKRGMGFCYEKGSQTQSIKNCPPEYKNEILRRYYIPHHIALSDAVTSSLNENGKALILDCHSFFPQPLPYEPDQNEKRPEICIGTDDFHTSKQLETTVENFFRSRDFHVGFNAPYSGTMVPLRYYRKDKRVQSIMVEVNRGLYLEPGTSRKSSNFQKMQMVLFELEALLSNEESIWELL